MNWWAKIQRISVSGRRTSLRVTDPRFSVRHLAQQFRAADASRHFSSGNQKTLPVIFRRPQRPGCVRPIQCRMDVFPIHLQGPRILLMGFEHG